MSIFEATARREISRALPTLETMIAGKKANVAIVSWLVPQLTQMFLYGGIPESIPDYFQSDDPAIGGSDISQAPVTHIAWRSYQKLATALDAAKISNVEIIGIETHDRERLTKKQDAFASADNFVFTRGGIASLKLLLRAILFNLAAGDSKKLIIIQNNGGDKDLGGYWTPLLRALGIAHHKKRKIPELLKEAGIIVSVGTKDTITKLQAHGINTNRRNKKLAPPTLLSYPHGIKAVPITTNELKVGDAQVIVNLRNANVVIRNAKALLGYFFSPKETSGTYSGNTLEKIEMAKSRILDIGEQEVKKLGLNDAHIDEDEYKKLKWRLAIAHIKKMEMHVQKSAVENGQTGANNLVFFANDTGLHIEWFDNGEWKPLSFDPANAPPEFADAKNYMVKGKPFPGVELNHIYDSLGGARSFFKRLKDYKQRIEMESGRAIKLRAKNVSTYIAMPLVDEYDDVRLISSTSNIIYAIVLDPQPNLDAPTTSDFYLVPATDNPNNLTIEQLGRENTMGASPDAHALDTLFGQLGVPTLSKDKLEKRNAASVTLRSHPKPMGYTEIATIDWSQPGQSLEELFKKHNCFVFPNQKIDLAVIDPDPIYAKVKMLYVACEIAEGRQIRRDHIHGKIVAFPGIEKPEHPFAFFWQTFNHFRSFHLVKQLPHVLIDAIAPDTEVAERLIHHNLLKYRAPKDIQFSEPPHGAPPPENVYRLAVLASASTKQPMHLLKIEHFLHEVCLSVPNTPIVIKNGGGFDGGMGQTHRVIDTIRASTALLNVGSIYRHEIQCLDTLHLEGCFHSVFSDSERHPHDCFEITKEIPERKDKILDADGVVCFDGGIGSLSEALHLIIQKRELEKEKAQIPLVFVNSEGAYTPLQAMLPQKWCRENGIYFVNADMLGKDYYLRDTNDQARMAGEAAAKIITKHREKWLETQPRAKLSSRNRDRKFGHPYQG